MLQTTRQQAIMTWLVMRVQTETDLQHLSCAKAQYDGNEANTHRQKCVDKQK